MNSDSRTCRLRNCLITILELEGALEQTQLGAALQKEFVVLKDVMLRLEKLSIDENDVQRIEIATGRFLEELKETLGGRVSSGAGARVLQ